MWPKGVRHIQGVHCRAAQHDTNNKFLIFLMQSVATCPTAKAHKALQLAY
jgi:hypothetical protein